jgi:hypothetical protein
VNALRRVLTIGLAVVAVVSVGRAVAAPAAHHQVVLTGQSLAQPIGFYTPGKLASCIFYGNFASHGKTPALWCGQGARGVLIRWGKPKLVGSGPFLWSVNGGSGPVGGFRLNYGERWWGNRQGKQGHRAEQGSCPLPLHEHRRWAHVQS